MLQGSREAPTDMKTSPLKKKGQAKKEKTEIAPGFINPKTLIEGHHYVGLSIWIKKSPEIGSTAKIMYSELADIFGIYHEAFLSIKTMSERLGVGRHAILLAEKEIETENLVHVERKVGHPNRYTFPAEPATTWAKERGVDWVAPPKVVKGNQSPNATGTPVGNQSPNATGTSHQMRLPTSHQMRLPPVAKGDTSIPHAVSPQSSTPDLVYPHTTVSPKDMMIRARLEKIKAKLPTPIEVLWKAQQVAPLAVDVVAAVKPLSPPSLTSETPPAQPTPHPTDSPIPPLPPAPPSVWAAMAPDAPPEPKLPIPPTPWPYEPQSPQAKPMDLLERPPGLKPWEPLPQKYDRLMLRQAEALALLGEEEFRFSVEDCRRVLVTRPYAQAILVLPYILVADWRSRTPPKTTFTNINAGLLASPKMNWLWRSLLDNAGFEAIEASRPETDTEKYQRERYERLEKEEEVRRLESIAAGEKEEARMAAEQKAKEEAVVH